MRFEGARRLPRPIPPLGRSHQGGAAARLQASSASPARRALDLAQAGLPTALQSNLPPGPPCLGSSVSSGERLVRPPTTPASPSGRRSPASGSSTHYCTPPCRWPATGRILAMCNGAARLFAPRRIREQASCTYVMLRWLPSYFCWPSSPSGNGWCPRGRSAKACPRTARTTTPSLRAWGVSRDRL